MRGACRFRLNFWEIEPMFAFAPAAQSVVPVAGRPDVLFPVHRIYCVGRNYAEHDLEMGGTGRGTPCFFAKPADAVVAIDPKKTAEVDFPSMTENLQHEVELVIAIGKGGCDIAVEDARSHVYGWAVGVDLTRRDLQAAAKEQRRPWTTAKGFDQSAPVSYIKPIDEAPDMQRADLWLYVNNQERQKGNTAAMIWSIDEVIAEISRYWELRPGDLIFTGSPAGVARIVKCDVVRAGCSGAGTIEFKLV